MARILIVDDATVMRLMIKTILINAGHEVIGEAANGKLAMSEYKRLLPDLVTMDLTMPEVNGIEAVHGIISDFPDAKIIMISAIAQKELILQALRFGAKNYILKPISAEKLIGAINTILGTNNQVMEKKASVKVDSKAFDDKIRDLKKSINQVNQSIRTYDGDKNR
jgi:two-component system chemotaxis response regulator CheY